MPSSKSTKRLREQTTGRSRSFGGCATCRIRHIKCDETRPTCLMCEHVGATCGGYEKSIFFTSEEDDGIERFRRPLFTEKEREKMSHYLVSSVPTKLLRVLSQIDQECENLTPNFSLDFCINRGPFGAFRLTQSDETGGAHEGLNASFEDSLIPIDVVDDDFLSPSAFAFSPGTQDMLENFIQTSGQVDEAFASDSIHDHLSTCRVTEISGETITLTTNEHLLSSLSPPHSTTLQLIPRSDTVASGIATIDDEVPKSAIHLLKHYSSTVVGLLTPSRHSKTLWHVLFLPHVKSSLAALSMGEELDHASLCSFYGTLAISAFHLKAVSKQQSWSQEAAQYKMRARENIRITLRTAYNVPKVAKYKTTLIALLTMVQLSMFDGDWKQTECYLLEAEKFIRLRGLPKRKSRKRRLLHHCYAFMRLLHESLFMMTTDSLQRLHVRLAVESSGLVIASADSLIFRLSPWGNLVQKMLEHRSQEEAENDLHLEHPGFFSATMYPEIYGLPEEWLFMLSQVIRLGNERDPKQDGTSHLSLKEFTMRAKDLEQIIVNWRRPPAEIFHSNADANSVDESVLQPLLNALHQALIIYFYRRIYDVDASMLQSRVEKVCKNLTQCDEADSGRIRYTSIFMWPAFIAACEAEEADLQLPFNRWFEDCVVQSGQSSFEHMYSTVKQVWQERGRNQGSSVTWLDFMMNSNVIQ